MKKEMFFYILLTSLIALLAISGCDMADSGAQAARPTTTGNGGGNGGGGGEVPDYGDLVILYRQDNGVPILDGNQCQQPIAYPSDTCLVDCTGLDPCLVPLNPDTCAVAVGYESCTKEVDFGRISSVRAPDAMLQSQLDEVVVNLATADCVTLDPAGRLVASRVTDGVVTTSEIDSPLQNLAIYKQLMLEGYLGDEFFPIDLPAGALITAARGLGATSDKGGQINVDLVAYLNQIMGLTDASVLPVMCIEVKAEVEGKIQLVEKCFLDYSSYGYNRAENFMGLSAPPYIPAGQPMEGWFEYLAVIDPDVVPPYFQINQGPILNAVFDDGLGGYHTGNTAGDIGGFVQAADDTRAVIDYMHNWPVPSDYPTAVPCEVSGNMTYDVSISEESGLQVPKKMVDGSEGREFVVSVANQSSSPDPATGHVTVTAIATSGVHIEGSPWQYNFNDIAPGASQSWTTFFTVNLGERTTINWMATAVAPHDVNTANNTVTATTNILVTSGGGGE